MIANFKVLIRTREREELVVFQQNCCSRYLDQSFDQNLKILLNKNMQNLAVKTLWVKVDTKNKKIFGTKIKRESKHLF